MLNILLLGSGGREHAFAFKISQSKIPHHLFILPGNAGTALYGTNLEGNPSDSAQVIRLVREKHIHMVICGPEDPLVRGIRDAIFREPDLQSLIFVGPSQASARLEGSKAFAKHFMTRYGIPTARYLEVSAPNLREGMEFLGTLAPPYVLKADGLAAGKGVLILSSPEEAKKELEAFILRGKMGEAGNKVVIEEYLHGVECSCFVFTDGEHYQILPFAKDYKRIGEGDTGANTGGMGAVSPVPFVHKDFIRRVEERIVRPTLEGMHKEGTPYEGFLFIGLMNVKGDPYVIEYNCRMGDPETQAVFPRLNVDFIEWFHAFHERKLDLFSLPVTEETAATVVLASHGYPGTFEKNKEITIPENIPGNVTVFCAGVKKENGKWLSNGGRVLAVTALDFNPLEALETAMKYAGLVQFENKYFRKDIGKDVFGEYKMRKE